MRSKAVCQILAALCAAVVPAARAAEAGPVTVSAIELSSNPLHQTLFRGKVDRAKTINLSFEHLGRIVSVESIGTPAKACYLDKDNNVVRPGDPLAAQDPRVYEYQVQIDQANVRSAEAALDEAKQQFERMQQLSEKKAASQKELDKALKEFEMAKAKLLSAQASLSKSMYDLDACTLRAPFSGQIEDLYYNLGTCVDKGKDVIKFSVIGIVKVVVPVPESVSRNIGKTDPIYVYPADGSEPVGALLYQEETLDPGILNLYVGNQETPIKRNMTDEERKLKKISAIAWAAKDHQEDRSAPAWVPVKSIFKEADGRSFVWRGRGQKIAMRSGKAIDRVFAAEKVYIEPDNLFRIIGLLNYQRLKEWGNIDTFDVILTAAPEDLQDGEKVLFAEKRWLFRPGESVKVKIPSLAEPGFYVPSEAVYQEASGEKYVYILDDGRARKSPVKIDGNFDLIFRISGPQVKEGIRVLVPEEKSDLRDGLPVVVAAAVKSPLMRINKREADEILKKFDTQKKN